MATKPTRASTAHIVPFGLRLQPELKSRLEESAQASGRSLNAEIAARLEGSFEPQLDSETAKALQALLSASENQDRLIRTQQRLLGTTGTVMAAALALGPPPEDETSKFLHGTSLKYAEAIAHDDLAEAAGAMMELITYGQQRGWYDKNGQLTQEMREMIQRQRSSPPPRLKNKK
jgi:hypothetical protein